MYAIKNDYSRVISSDELDQILQESAEYFAGKSSDEVINESGLMAQGKISQILGGRFDLDIEFAKVPPVNAAAVDTRDQNLLRCYLHISTYWLFFVINPRDIPELRQNAYDACVKELEETRDGTLNTTLPELEDAPQALQFAGASKFISKPFSDPLVQDDEETNPIP